MTASLIVAICGLVFSCLSLGWQAANFVLTGGRVKVKLSAGAMNSGGMVTMPPRNFTPQALAQIQTQGYPVPIVAVEVANVGRQPVTVAKWNLLHATGVSYMPVAAAIGKPLPFRLEVGASETWAVELKTVLDIVAATEATITSNSGRGVRGVVELADGRSRRTTETLHLT